ncbi:hypothetical protein U9M48_026204 [Paspalum notatum var. saurae]|uniref:Uncharacterized protein n=1 Tax=Paspalum notatum var. saurae TaxID=547442 RepID=A0AAQ3WYS1_PASNO
MAAMCGRCRVGSRSTRQRWRAAPPWSGSAWGPLAGVRRSRAEFGPRRPTRAAVGSALHGEVEVVCGHWSGVSLGVLWCCGHSAPPSSSGAVATVHGMARWAELLAGAVGIKSTTRSQRRLLFRFGGSSWCPAHIDGRGQEIGREEEIGYCVDPVVSFIRCSIARMHEEIKPLPSPPSTAELPFILSHRVRQQAPAPLFPAFIPATLLPVFPCIKGTNCSGPRSLEELTKMTHNFYDDTTLPKLVPDFASLELSLVDERIMSDFMHTRGLNMSSFSCIMGVELAEQLEFEGDLCYHA